MLTLTRVCPLHAKLGESAEACSGIQNDLWYNEEVWIRPDGEFDKVIVYTDGGVTPTMTRSIIVAIEAGKTIEYRTLSK